MLRNLPKAYSWGNDERTALYLKIWERENDFEDVDYWLYTKNETPGADLSGTWRFERWEEHEQDDGSIRREFRTWTWEVIGDVLTYTFTSQQEEDYGTDRMHVWSQTGTVEQNTEGMFLWQTVTVATENGQPEDDIIGQRLRWGYFPAGDSLIISPFWDEMRYDAELVPVR